MSRLRILRPRVAAAPTRGTIVVPGSWRANKSGSSARGYGYRWQKERVEYLARHPLCVMCAAEGRVTEATVVDHKKPHQGRQDLFWDQSNWQSLCAPHHDVDKARAEREMGLR